MPSTPTPDPRPPKTPDAPVAPDTPIPERILIVRPSALGDVARTVPCLVSLRNAYPDARIDWLVNAPFAAAIASHPALGAGRGLAPTAPVDSNAAAGASPRPGVIPFDRRNAASALRLMRDLRANRYDMAIDLQGLARSGLFTRATAAPRRVGYANARELAWLAYNLRHHVADHLHAVDRMLGLLDAQGIPPLADLALHVNADDHRWLSGYLAERGLAPGRYACVAPTAQWGCKCWPVARYAQLTKRLLRHEDIDGVMILAAPSELAGVQAGFASLEPQERGQTLTPHTSVGQLMAVIQRARLLVCNDSAPLHLAVGLGTPTVSLFGPTDPARVGPYPLDHPSHRVLRSPSAVGKTLAYRRQRDDDTLISELTLESVEAACAAHLEAIRHP